MNDVYDVEPEDVNDDPKAAVLAAARVVARLHRDNEEAGLQIALFHLSNVVADMEAQGEPDAAVLVAARVVSRMHRHKDGAYLRLALHNLSNVVANMEAQEAAADDWPPAFI